MYISKTGPLSQKERTALKKIKKILKEFNFGPKYLGNVFLEKPDKEICKSLLVLIGEEKGRIVLNTLRILGPRLEKLWLSDKPRVLKYSQALRKIINQKRFRNLFAKLNFLFGNLPRTLLIKTLILPEEYAHIGGSANTSGNVVTVEVRNEEDVVPGALVALHELTHKLVRSKNFTFKTNEKILDAYKKNIPHFQYMSKEEALEEFFLLFFLPDGYLAQELDKNIPLDKHVRKLPAKLNERIVYLIQNNLPIRQHEINLFKKFLTVKRRGASAPRK